MVAAADEGAGVGRMAEFGPRLREVVAARRRRGARPPARATVGRRRGEAAAALLRRAARQASRQVGPQPVERRLQRGRQRPRVVPGRSMSSQVLCSAPTNQVPSGCAMPRSREQRAHLGPVGHRREDSARSGRRGGPSRRRSRRPKGAGCSGCASRGRAITTSGAKSRGQADAAQETLHALGLLVVGEAEPRAAPASAGGLSAAAVSARRVARGRRTARASGAAAWPNAPGRQRAGDQRRQRRRRRAAPSAAGRPSRPRRVPWCRRSRQRRRWPRRRCVPGTAAASLPGAHVSRTSCAGVTTIGAERCRRASSSRPCQMHGDAEEAGGAEGLDGRVDFLEMAARAFLAVVHAEDELAPVGAGASASGRGRGWRRARRRSLRGSGARRPAARHGRAVGGRGGRGSPAAASRPGGPWPAIAHRTARGAGRGGTAASATQKHAEAARRCPPGLLPGPDQVRHLRPAGLVGRRQVLGGSATSALARVAQVLRQAAVAHRVAHEELGRWWRKCQRSRSSAGLDVPRRRHRRWAKKALEGEAHRQIVDHVDRRVVRPP